MSILKIIRKIIDYFRYGTKKYGLLQDETDDRSFGSNVLVEPRDEDLVKKTFVVFDPTPLDQMDNDHCVGFGGAYETEAWSGVVCSGSFIFAMCKRLEGTMKTFGTSLLKKCKAKLKWGVCRKEMWDYKKGHRNYYSSWWKIPKEAYDDAAQRKDSAFFQMVRKEGWTNFNTIRALLWRLRKDRVLVDSGNYGHDITIIGYVDKTWNGLEDLHPQLQEIIKTNNIRDHLICKDSYGDRTFYKGYRFMPSSEARTIATPYFSIGMSRDLAELLVTYNGKAVRLPESKECFLIRESEKHHLRNEAHGWSHGVLLFNENYVHVLQKREFDLIPTGEPTKFSDGQNWEIITRILEKLERTELIEAD